MGNLLSGSYIPLYAPTELGYQNSLEGEKTSAYCFIPSGKGYYIAGFGEEGHLQDYVGLHHIFRLIQAPGQAVDMKELDSNGVVDSDPRNQQLAIEPEECEERKAKLKELMETLRSRSRSKLRSA